MFFRYYAGATSLIARHYSLKALGLGLTLLALGGEVVGEPLRYAVEDFKGANDREKINQALQAMVGVKGPKELVFQCREYQIESASTKSFEPVLGVSNLIDITLAGNGAVLVAKNQLEQEMGTFFKLSNFKNLTIKDLSLTFRPLPFVQGLIVAVDQSKNVVDLALDEKFKGWQEINGFTPNSKLWCRVGQKAHPAWPKAHSPSWLGASFVPLKEQSEEHLKKGIIRVRAGKFDLNKTINGTYNWSLGDPMVIWKRGAQDGFCFEVGEGLILKNIHIDSALHYSLKCRGIVDGIIENCTIQPVEGGMLSGCADGIDLQQSIRVTVTNCQIHSNGDDGISLLNHAQHGYNGEHGERKLGSPYPETNQWITITNNWLSGGNRNGLLILASQVNISNNLVEQTRQYGLKFCGDNTQIIGNTFRELASFAAYRHIDDELNTGVICSDEWLQKDTVIANNTLVGWHNMPGILLKSLKNARVIDNILSVGDENRLRVTPINPDMTKISAIAVVSGYYGDKNIPCVNILVENNRVVKNRFWSKFSESAMLQTTTGISCGNNQVLTALPQHLGDLPFKAKIQVGSAP